MSAAVGNSREGVGWYIWLPEKGKEIAAWTPVKVGEYTWSIGLSVPLPEILEQTGAGAEIRRIKLAMTIVTIAAFIFLGAWGYGAWGKERMAQALQESRRMLQTVLDTIPQAICWKDKQLAYLGCNQNYTRMAGAETFADLVGSQGKGLQTWANEKFHNTDLKILKGGKSILHERHSSLDALGNEVWLDTTRVPLFDAQNDVHGIMIMYEDVTDRVRIDEIMIQTEKMTSVGGLAAGMAHEINNPLAGMVQSANVIKSRLEDCNMPANLKAAGELGLSMKNITAFMDKRGIFRMIDGMQESGARMVDIVNSMLSFARKSDATGFSSHYPDELMDKILGMAAMEYDLKKQYDFKSIEIIKEYANDLPMLPCEGAKIQQVLLNILRNGAQAMQMAKTQSPRFTLRIYTKGAPEMVHIEIEDNGPGMDEKTVQKSLTPSLPQNRSGLVQGSGCLSPTLSSLKSIKGQWMSCLNREKEPRLSLNSLSTQIKQLFKARDHHHGCTAF